MALVLLLLLGFSVRTVRFCMLSSSRGRRGLQRHNFLAFSDSFLILRWRPATKSKRLLIWVAVIAVPLVLSFGGDSRPCLSLRSHSVLFAIAPYFPLTLLFVVWSKTLRHLSSFVAAVCSDLVWSRCMRSSVKLASTQWLYGWLSFCGWASSLTVAARWIAGRTDGRWTDKHGIKGRVRTSWWSCQPDRFGVLAASGNILSCLPSSIYCFYNYSHYP